MKVIIAGGTGFIGKAMVRRYLAAGHTVTVVGRRCEKIQRIFGDSVKAVDWQTLDKQIIQAADLVINLTGATIGEKRWTKKRKQEILDSRIQSTKQLVALCVELGKASPAFFNTSAIGTYGFQKPVPDGLPRGMDEQEPIDFDAKPDFLSEIGRAWEKATQPAITAGVRVVIMRFGVVFSGDGGALSELKRPFQFFVGGSIGQGRQPFSWIARKDLLNAIDFVFEQKDVRGPVNFVAPQCVTQKQLAQAIGVAMHRPSFFPLPGIVLKLLFGQLADELLLHGQHVLPGVLQRLGFHFKFPDVQSVLNAELR